MNDISMVKYEECCGCGACFNKCPVGAIEMKEEIKTGGGLVPVINSEKCIHCGMCLNACPVYNKQKSDSNYNIPEIYAVMAKDEIRVKSASGGMFALLAEYILNKGGYVCGAVFRDDFSVHHIIVDNKNDLDKIKGSKYILSDIEKCYSKIKELLKNEKYVLFSGTPCQVAGLYSFLGKKYNTLLTADLLCHGAPSNGVWQKYLTENFDGKINSVNFRDKSLGWVLTSMTIINNQNETVIKNFKEDLYQEGFHKGVFNRFSCQPCLFAKFPRQGDFTIGDFWKIHVIAPEMSDSKGTSYVCVNNDLAKNIFNELKDKIYKYKPISFKDAASLNINQLLYQPAQPHPRRNEFLRHFDKLSFNKNAKMCLKNQYDICLVCNWYGSNYGSILVQYAVYKIIESLGCSIKMLDKPLDIWGNHPNSDTVAFDFGKRHYNITHKYNTWDLHNLNSHFDKFVVGSDQLFRPVLNMPFVFLDWVNNYKNKIAFGTSFGISNFPASKEHILKAKYLLKRFNNLALRETPPELCKDLFNIEPTRIIDPSLILPLEEYLKLADNVKDLTVEKPYLLTYMLDLDNEKVKLIKHIAKQLNLEIINIQNQSPRQRVESELEYLKEDYTPEEFLHLYKNASFVVTDSYHGTCFSVKFNKPFISLINQGRGGIRYDMFKPMDILHRFFAEPNEVYDNNIIFEPVDYTKANAYIKEKAEFAINWLKNALENNDNDTRYTDFENYFEITKNDFDRRIAQLSNQVSEQKAYIEELTNKAHKIKNKFGLLQEIFSVRNDGKNHKVITILGLKLKFKRKQKKKK